MDTSIEKLPTRCPTCDAAMKRFAKGDCHSSGEYNEEATFKCGSRYRYTPNFPTHGAELMDHCHKDWKTHRAKITIEVEFRGPGKGDPDLRLPETVNNLHMSFGSTTLPIVHDGSESSVRAELKKATIKVGKRKAITITDKKLEDVKKPIFFLDD